MGFCRCKWEFGLCSIFTEIQTTCSRHRMTWYDLQKQKSDFLEKKKDAKTISLVLLVSQKHKTGQSWTERFK